MALSLGSDLLLHCYWDLDGESSYPTYAQRWFPINNIAAILPSLRPFVVIEGIALAINHIFCNRCAVSCLEIRHVAHLLIMPSSYLNFLVGGAIAWNMCHHP